MLASPNHNAYSNRGHGNRATSTLRPSSSQKLFAVRACIRRKAARQVTKESRIAYRAKLDEGLPVSECGLEESVERELSEVIVAILQRLSLGHSKEASTLVSRFERCNL